VGWKMNSWEVGGVLVKEESVRGGSLGERSGVRARCHWMCGSGNVSSEECVEVAGGPLGLQEHEELVKCRGLCMER